MSGGKINISRATKKIMAYLKRNNFPVASPDRKIIMEILKLEKGKKSKK